jgi:hypothetical protein
MVASDSISRTKSRRLLLRFGILRPGERANEVVPMTAVPLSMASRTRAGFSSSRIASRLRIEIAQRRRRTVAASTRRTRPVEAREAASWRCPLISSRVPESSRDASAVATRGRLSASVALQVWRTTSRAASSGGDSPSARRIAWSRPIRPVSFRIAGGIASIPRRFVATSFVGKLRERPHDVIDVRGRPQGAMKDLDRLACAALGQDVHRVDRGLGIVAIVALERIGAAIEPALNDRWRPASSEHRGARSLPRAQR